MREAEVTGPSDVVIDHIEYDSRLIKKDGLFVAISGFRTDGYSFVDQARANGAVAVMGERNGCEAIATHVKVTDARQALADVAARFYGYPAQEMTCCGVTGTNGKTTTCHLIRHILKAGRVEAGLVTSERYDACKEQFKPERTTPESLDLQRLLYLMKTHGCQWAILEVSSHALALRRVENIPFQVAVFTNLTRDHLDFHKTMAEYLRVKALLLQKLEGPACVAVINHDVPEFRTLYDLTPGALIRYSLEDHAAEVYCPSFELRAERTFADLHTPFGHATVELRLCGKFNLHNAVAAAAAGVALGIDLESIVSGLQAAKPVPGRFNSVDIGQPYAVFIDYAHTPDAIAHLCAAAREISKGRLLILFGCGGDRDPGKRPMMGKAATTLADFTVVTSDNPRSEDPLAIIDQIKPGLTGSSYRIVPDRREAIAAVLHMAEPGDVILLAGKGAENYQEIAGVRHHFSDEEEARKVLAEQGYRTDVTEGER